MKIIKVHNKQFQVHITKEQVDNRIIELAEIINKTYSGKNPLLLSILSGSFMFTSDLMKKITIDCELTFMRIKSYAGLKSGGDVKILMGVSEEINDRHVLVIEDIIDTGNTIQQIFHQVKKYNPKDLKVMSFLFKPEAMKTDYKPDYVGFEVENKFFVGYGLDYDGHGRNHPGVYILSE